MLTFHLLGTNGDLDTYPDDDCLGDIAILRSFLINHLKNVFSAYFLWRNETTTKSPAQFFGQLGEVKADTGAEIDQFHIEKPSKSGLMGNMSGYPNFICLKNWSGYFFVDFFFAPKATFGVWWLETQEHNKCAEPMKHGRFERKRHVFSRKDDMSWNQKPLKSILYVL